MRLNNENDQFEVENLFLYQCETSEDAIQLFGQGIKNRIVSSHKYNHASSRSHVIFSL